MRGRFNTHCDLYAGPGAAVPNAFIGTFPCRLVIEDAINTVGNGAPYIHRYMTIDGYRPVGAWTVPFFGMDAALSDQVAVPPGSAPRWWVLYTDIILWHALTPYWRSYLVELPIPSPLVTGGVVLDGSSLWSRASAHVPLGGVELDGSGITSLTRALIGSGGVELDGSGLVVRSFVLVGRGGVELDGKCDRIVAVNFFASGGVEVNGSADWVRAGAIIGSGGVEVDSSGLVARTRSLVGSGGVEVNGAATWTFTAGAVHGSAIFDHDDIWTALATGITCECYGEGGHGGGAAVGPSVRHGGGGGGGYSLATITGLTIGTNYSIHVGAGGTGNDTFFDAGANCLAKAGQTSPDRNGGSGAGFGTGAIKFGGGHGGGAGAGPGGGGGGACGSEGGNGGDGADYTGAGAAAGGVAVTSDGGNGGAGGNAGDGGAGGAPGGGGGGADDTLPSADGSGSHGRIKIAW